MTTTLVYGLAIAGRAVAKELVARGQRVVLADDSNKDSAIAAHNKFAHELGARFVSSPDARQLQEINW